MNPGEGRFSAEQNEGVGVWNRYVQRKVGRQKKSLGKGRSAGKSEGILEKDLEEEPKRIGNSLRSP